MNKSFGQHIREERKLMSLTAETLAQSCGVSRSFITLIENGSRMPGKKLLKKIASSLNMSNSKIIDWYLEDLNQQIRKYFE